MIQSVCSAPLIAFRLPTSTSRLCVLNRLGSHRFCGETSLSVYLRIQAKGLCQPLPSQEAQSTEGKPAKNPPKEENVQKCYAREGNKVKVLLKM